MNSDSTRWAREAPGIYDGHGRTYFFGEYQGFRQVLGTTQNLSVPTERSAGDLTPRLFPAIR